MPAETTTGQDFQAALSEQRRSEGDAPPVTFTLGGETFECAPTKLSGWTVIRLQAVKANDVEKAAQAVERFYEVLVKKDDWQRFIDTVESADNPVDDVELMETIGDIIEAYAARPSKRSSGLPDGPSSTGPSSTPGSSLTTATPGAVPFSRARAS